MAIPTPSISAATSGQARPACSEIAASALTSASTEPTERSIPAVVITKVIATATIISGALCRRMLRILISVRKVLVISENVTVITIKNAAMLSTPPLSRMISLARSPSAGRLAMAVKSAPPRRPGRQRRSSGIFAPRSD